MHDIRRPLAALLLLGLAATSPVAAQGAPTDSSALRLAQGKRLFEGKGLCFSCHGVQGEGMLGPTTRLSEGKIWLHTKGTLWEIAAVIKSGIESDKSRSGTVMPPRGGSRITDAEAELLAAYVLELHKRTPSK